MQRDYAFDSPSTLKQPKIEDTAVLGESVSGISRSGRVRKKPAKLMEMEDFETPEVATTDADGKSQKQHKKGEYSVVASGAAALGLEELVKEEPTDGFDDIDCIPHSHPHSVYLTENKKVKNQKPKRQKPKKQKVPGGKIVKERKKGRPMTQYTLWCRSHRPYIVAENPDMDFAGISRRLGEVWQTLPDKEKMFWRCQAKLLPPRILPPQTLPPQTLPPKTLPPKTLSPKTLVNLGTSSDIRFVKKPLIKRPKTIYYSCY